jgi:tetratricopeptide (TPR) repeat protein
VVLLKAEDVWNDANAEQNEEINSWLIRVENALRATTGRVILKTNPLYAEMSNLLNLAQLSFQEGQSLLEQGNTGAAEQSFQAAEEKIAYVKDPFPINQAAGVLLLRIEQIRDPANFADLFRTRFEEAVSMGGTEDEAIGYSLLKDLQTINPGYPGINSAIFNAEIRLGIRERPPDQRKIAEANRLYEEARDILAKTRVSDIDLEVALDKLNEAYDNNPNDGKITSLKDRAQLLRGGSATILDTQDQQQFRLAEQLFLDRKYFEALAVVERLLADPRNQRYAPLNDLKRRIDSFI